MTTSRHNPTTIFGEHIAANMEAGRHASIPTDAATRGLSQIGADFMPSSLTGIISQSSQNAKASEARSRNADIIEHYSEWLDDNHDIAMTRLSDTQLSFNTDGHPYLFATGNETAIADWNAHSITIDTTRLENDHLSFLHENAGITMSLGDQNSIQDYRKHATEWPDSGYVLEEITKDTRLYPYLRERPYPEESLTRATAVAMVYRYANVLSLAEEMDLLKRGHHPPHKIAALTWLHSLHGDQLTEIEDLADGQFQQLHESLDDLETMSAESETYQALFAYMARERVQLEALLALFHAGRISVDSLRRIAHALDDRASALIPITPRLITLQDDIPLQRSAQRDADTWWCRLLPVT